MQKLNKNWLIIITITSFFLLNFPIIKTIDDKLIFGYIPLNYIYFYFVWFLIIVILRAIIIKMTK